MKGKQQRKKKYTKINPDCVEVLHLINVLRWIVKCTALLLFIPMTYNDLMRKKYVVNGRLTNVVLLTLSAPRYDSLCFRGFDKEMKRSEEYQGLYIYIHICSYMTHIRLMYNRIYEYCCIDKFRCFMLHRYCTHTKKLNIHWHEKKM